jgi:hypothetical protein
MKNKPIHKVVIARFTPARWELFKQLTFQYFPEWSKASDNMMANVALNFALGRLQEYRAMKAGGKK